MSKMVILGRNIEKCRVGYRGKTCKAFGREGGSCRWLPLTTPWYLPPRPRPPVGWACGGTLSAAPWFRCCGESANHHCRRHLHHQYHRKNSCHHHHRHTTLIIKHCHSCLMRENYCADFRFLHGAGVGYHAGGGEVQPP